MFFKKFDYLSPQITFYFKGDKIHSSIFSGILSIISYSLIFAFTIYNTSDFINKVNPIIYYYNRYVKDTGSFPLNSSSIFHYFQLINTDGEPDIEIDYDAIRIIGIDRSIDNYMRNYNLSRINHWIYGPCNYNEINTDDELTKIIPENLFSQSACIKEYYNCITQKYSKIGESGFRWPVLTYGASNPNRTLYGIVIEKCHNDSLKKNCKSNEEINKFFNQYAIKLNIIDEYVDVLNYENPYIKYIYAITNGLHLGTISLNNINFNPSLTKTHKGLFFDRIVEIKSFAYSQNVKISLSPEKTSIVAAFFFWMQNVMTYNERFYKKFLVYFSEIGGFANFVLLIALAINFLVSNYIIILDTEELVLNIDKVNYDKDNIFKKPTIYRIIDELFHPPKMKNDKDKKNKSQNQKSNLSFLKKRSDYNNNKENGGPKSEPLKILYSQNKRKKNYYNNKWINISNKKQKRDSVFLPLSDKKSIEMQKVNQSQKLESYHENLIDLQNIRVNINLYNLQNKRSKKKDHSDKSLKKNNFTWFNYFCYLAFFKKYNPKIKYLEDIRAQIISEENLLQNYSDIYKLLKFCNIKNHNYYEINGIC